MNARTLSDTLRLQFSYIAYTFKVNLESLGEDDALIQPAPAGNCANWVAGHLLHSRAGLLALLEAEPPFSRDKYQRYERSSEPVTATDDILPLAGMVEDFETAQAPLLAALENLEDTFLAKKAPISPADNPDETMGTLLAGLAFHEAYHVGQLGVLRRMAGAAGAIK